MLYNISKRSYAKRHANLRQLPIKNHDKLRKII